jgi:hypothetical protein
LKVVLPQASPSPVTLRAARVHSLVIYVLLGLLLVDTAGFGEYKPHWHIYTAAAGFFLIILALLVWALRDPRPSLWRAEVFLPLLGLGAAYANKGYAGEPWLVPLMSAACWVTALAMIYLLVRAAAPRRLRALGDPWPAILVAAGVLYAAILVATPEPYIDVWHQMNSSGDALLVGKNPYAIPIPDFYRGQQPFGFDAPGFSYPPLVLLVSALARFCEIDVRWFWLAGILGGAALLRDIARRRGATPAVANLLGLLFLFVPHEAWLVRFGHSEPLTGVLLVAAVHCLIAGRRGAGMALLGLFLGSKQYLAATAPILLCYATSWRDVGWLAAGAALPWLPFAAWNFHALWAAAIQTHLDRPVRPESLTWNAWRLDEGYRPLARWVALAFGAGGAGAAGVALRRWRLGEAGLAFGVAGVLVITLFLGPQAFCNYYVLVTWCVLLAGAAAPAWVKPVEVVEVVPEVQVVVEEVAQEPSPPRRLSRRERRALTGRGG